jgi:hypothetical protein
MVGCEHELTRRLRRFELAALIRPCTTSTMKQFVGQTNVVSEIRDQRSEIETAALEKPSVGNSF